MYRLKEKDLYCEKFNCTKEDFDRALEIFWRLKKTSCTLKKLLSRMVQLDLDNLEELIKLNSLREASYTPRFWVLCLNLSQEEAELKVLEYKTNKATSLQGFIKRHGLEKGQELFKKFQETSAISGSEEWWRDRYQDNWYIEKVKSKRKASPWCTEYWEEKGYPLEEAILQVSDYQRKNSGVFREYYRSKDLSEEEIHEIFKEINYKKSLTSRNRQHLKDIYGNQWREHYEKTATNYRKNMESKGTWVPLEQLDDFVKYKTLVDFYTEMSLLQYELPNIQLRSKKFHVDHKYSKKSGFVNNIPPEIVGSIVNLEILPFLENCIKRAKNSITLEQLLCNYKELLKKEQREKLKLNESKESN